MGYSEETTFRGDSGTVYRFEVHDLRSRFRNVEGVYSFARKMRSPAGGHVFLPLYIGQTPELGARLREHEKLTAVALAGCDSICVMPGADEARRREIVADLLAAHMAPCNER